MILLDTHTWVWWVCRRADQIPRSLDELLSSTVETVAVASVSCLEVAVLVRKGRLELSHDLGSWFELAIERCGLELLPLTPSIAARSAELPSLYRDPIDRVLIATAQHYDALLVTKDRDVGACAEIRTRWA